MTENRQKIERWLAAVYAHPSFTEADHAAARAIDRDGWLTDERVDVSNLVRVGAVHVTDDGLHTMIDPFQWGYRG